MTTSTTRIFSLLLFLSMLIGPVWATTGTFSPDEAPAKSAILSPADVMNADGTLDLTGPRGSVDMSGWTLGFGEHDAPRLVPAAPALMPTWTPLGSGVNDNIFALIVDGNGDLYAGGEFTTAGGTPASGVAKWDGSAWSAFGSGTGPAAINDVNALALDGAGNLYAGGQFTDAGGVTVNYVAKWDGAAWTDLGGGMNSTVAALAFDASGNLFVGGFFTQAGGASANRIAMWDGAAWSALGTGLNGAAMDFAFDSAGDLIVAGEFTTAGGSTANRVAKWDGAAWSTFGTGVDGNAATLVIDNSGHLFVGGNFANAGGTPASRIARWDGTSWTALGTGMNNWVDELALDGAGDLYAAGNFTDAGGVSANYIAKWDGTAWSAINTGMNDLVRGLVIDNGGNLYAGGNFTTAGGIAANRVVKWDGAAPPPPSRMWMAVGTGMGNNGVNDIAFAPSGNVYAGGNFTSAGGAPISFIAEWDGTTWSAVGTGVNSSLNAVVTDGAGNLYVGGAFTEAGGASANYIAKWDGSTWSALGSGMNDAVNTLALDAAGNLYAGGWFTTAGGVSAARMAMWDGTNWSALGSGLNDVPHELLFDSAGDLYAGGVFTVAGGVSANRIARWDGTNWSALGTGVNGGVVALAMDASGTLYAGGDFTTAGGVSADRIAQWDGSAWSDMGSGADITVESMAFDGDGDLLVGGRFLTMNGLTVNRIARWDGAAWSAFSSGANDRVIVLRANSGGDVYAGGPFTNIDGVAADRIAKWAFASTPPPPSVTVTSPNGGETWTAGTTETITWADNITEDVRILLLKGGAYYRTIAAATPSNGSYDYVVPANLQGGSDYTVRVRSVSDPSLSDDSDATFAVASSLVITSPSTGAAWMAGTRQEITWTSNISPGETVRIELHRNGSLNTTLTPSHPNDGHYYYVIDSSTFATTGYTIVVQLVSDPTVQDESGTFEITAPAETVTLTAPNGGESWQAGTTQTVTWTSNFADNVQIMLYKNGTFDRTIAGSTPSDGSHSWTLPKKLMPGATYTVRIRKKSDYRVRDDSDATFTVTAPMPAPIIGIAAKAGAADVLPTLPGGVIAWQPVAEAEAYRIEVAADAAFETVRFEQTLTGTSFDAHAALPEQTGTDLWVRVRAEAGDVFSAWAEARLAGETPEAFELEGNYPNPFNPSTTIRYALKEATDVRLTVYDALGREVAVLADGPQVAGRYQVRFDAVNLPSGVYFTRIAAGSFEAIRPMMLAK